MGEPRNRNNRPAERIWLSALLVVVLVSCIASLSSGRAAGFTQATGSPQQETTQSSAGAALYKQKCAVCHGQPQERVPPLFLIRRRSAEDVIQTLTTGPMKQQAAGLSPEQIKDLAVFLTGKQPGA